MLKDFAIGGHFIGKRRNVLDPAPVHQRRSKMLSKEEFISRTFAIATDMSVETKWANHILSVDDHFIRFKNGKNVDAKRLEKMWPGLLQSELDASSANPIIMAATKGQGCVNVPMREIARRLRG